MNEDEKNFVIDMLKSEGWRILERLNDETIRQYRLLATQPPGAVEEQLRTWYSALASGREEVIQSIKSVVNQPKEG